MKTNPLIKAIICLLLSSGTLICQEYPFSGYGAGIDESKTINVDNKEESIHPLFFSNDAILRM